jgi:predicted RNA-binding protein associated with RNAse of E/G family
MNKDKWVNVIKKQVREVVDMDVTIVPIKELNAYLTLKEIKEVIEPHKIPVNGKWHTKLDKNYTIMEYSPLDKLYNVRVHINDKLEILEYYFDVILDHEIRNVDGRDVPFYNDLYLDVVYYQKALTESEPFILLDDRDELKSAFKNEIVNANKIMEELLEGKNEFVNRGLTDYLQYRKNNVESFK